MAHIIKIHVCAEMGREHREAVLEVELHDNYTEEDKQEACTEYFENWLINELSAGWSEVENA